ncbi:MAG: hypothetical protein EPO43_03480 [Rugosibacter sp.]|nr:MAG: hypothetical protein EPO43_03480 [Rugosibacter sp.]
MCRLLFLLVLLTTSSYADESVSICFNYGCATQSTVKFSSQQLNSVAQILAAAHNAAEERTLLAQVIGVLYAWAGEQTPIHADRGGNFADAGVQGAMDCIDHSTTTTRFLRLLEQRDALHFHHVIAATRRGWIFQHFTATIEEMPLAAMNATSVATTQRPRFAVDSWYVDNGKPAIVLPLAEWFNYGGPGA